MLSSLTSEQALQSSESPSVAHVCSTLSMSAKHSPCRWLLALRPVRHRSARRPPPCGSCTPEVVVGRRPEHEHQRREDRDQMNYPTRREEEEHQIRPRHELADGVSLGEPRDGADHDGKRPEYPEAYRQDEARPVPPAKHLRCYIDHHGKDEQPHTYADDNAAGARSQLPGYGFDDGEDRLEHARGDRSEPQHERRPDVVGRSNWSAHGRLAARWRLGPGVHRSLSIMSCSSSVVRLPRAYPRAPVASSG